MGAGPADYFIANALPFSAPHSHSEMVPDYIINPHPRFAALVENIRHRRGRKVDIRVPLFRDTHTPEFTSEKPSASAALADPTLDDSDQHIYMDAMAFGMGMCCLVIIESFIFAAL
jgi:glutamate--cysteine ligase catalytic subunit